jgi:hypothetical protein
MPLIIQSEAIFLFGGGGGGGTMLHLYSPYNNNLYPWGMHQVLIVRLLLYNPCHFSMCMVYHHYRYGVINT